MISEARLNDIAYLTELPRRPTTTEKDAKIMDAVPELIEAVRELKRSNDKLRADFETETKQHVETQRHLHQALEGQEKLLGASTKLHKENELLRLKYTEILEDMTRRQNGRLIKTQASFRGHPILLLAEQEECKTDEYVEFMLEIWNRWIKEVGLGG